ncbi:Mediator complex, subunit Med9 [Niveomyces insectorum RCEF 264]|uniref:Mediator of RNA polymerase II transcription subunit 9 n=1 Tax=Niveomyces insectorum RCEF 264 TaxID=1081102 RepID=A0A167S3T8_9HYPO|nr:Mediator complex, subunit Med9 [Niveomyces insectorum RCEF 264]
MDHPLALPKTFSPDALDTTAELAAILARLRPPPQASAAGGVRAGSGTTPQPAATPSASTSGVASGGGGTAPLTLRDLPTATDSLKHKLQHARVQIRALPDAGRTVAEQEAEMRALEARIEQQKAVLARLRADGARFAAGEQEQQQQQQPQQDEQPKDADKMET